MAPLDPAARRALRARAHHLHPVVAVGQHGLTPPVLREIDTALRAHELVKVRVFSDDRALREALLAQICEALDAAPVQHLGKLLVLFRPAPEEESRPRPGPRPRPAPGGPASARVHAATPRPRVFKGASAPSPAGLATKRRGAAGTGTAHRATGTTGRAAGTMGRAAGTTGPAAGKRGRAAGTAGRAAAGPQADRQDRGRTGGAPRAPHGVPRAGLPRRRRGAG